jgi:hypothetical protein
MHVVTVKNKFDQVVPLVKAIAAAAGILEGRVVGSSEPQSFVVDLYPGAASAYGMKARWGWSKYLAERPIVMR